MAGPAGRGYGPEDVDMMRSMAASSGYMAVLVMALYINSAEVVPMYHHPQRAVGVVSDPAVLGEPGADAEQPRADER